MSSHHQSGLHFSNVTLVALMQLAMVPVAAGKMGNGFAVLYESKYQKAF